MSALFSLTRPQLILTTRKLTSTTRKLTSTTRKLTSTSRKLTSTSRKLTSTSRTVATVSVSQVAPGSGLSLQLALETQTGMFLSPRHLCTAGPEGQVLVGPDTTMALMSCMQLQCSTPLTGRYYKSGPMPRQLCYSVAATAETGEVARADLVREVYGEVARADLVREVYGEAVRRLPLEGGVRGTLFLPAGERRLGVLCIGGAAGVKEDMAAHMAHRGHPALALGYFGLPGLPKTYSSVSLEYLEQAASLLAEHCQDGGVGVLGQSKGGDLALALAVTLGTKIRAVATLNGCIASAGGHMTHSGRPVFPGLGLDPQFTPLPRLDGSLDFLGAMKEVEEEVIIPVEKAQAEVLMIAGEEDRNWDSVRYADMAMARCRQKGRNHLTVETIPGLGHIVDLPYTPVCTAIRHALSPGGAPVYMGGEDRAAAGRGQATAMDRVVKFFSVMQ